MAAQELSYQIDSSSKSLRNPDSPKKKDTVIAEIMEDLIAEKKDVGRFERCLGAACPA